MSGSVTFSARGISPTIRPALPAGRRLPAASVQRSDAAVEHGGDVVDADQGAAGDEEWEGSVDVETAGFGVAEGGQERPVSLTGLHLGDLIGGEPAGVEEGVPPLGLGGLGDRLVLRSQPGDALGVAWERRIMSWAARSAPSLRSTPTSTSRAVGGGLVPSWAV